MKYLSYIITFTIFISGCGFQKPEYLKLISSAELNQVMQNEDIFLVDVHTPEQQHIMGSDLFVPYDEVEKNKDKFPKDKNSPIYLYCKSGHMANYAAKSLHDLGYSNLYNLDGGADAWRKAGLKFVVTKAG
jgi:rhodanese-related sulfurtransferase